MWRFARREITVDGEELYEMIASDITTEYAKTEALEQDKAELSRMNQELWDYYLSIDDSVHRQEILQAKMNIHDEMNRLMLSTVAADKKDTQALDNIFSLWEQNALLLCMEADKKANQQESNSVESLAKALGISLIWHGDLPPALSEKQKELFFFTAQEAIINAVKHAQAKTMEISFEEAPNELTAALQTTALCRRARCALRAGLQTLRCLPKSRTPKSARKLIKNLQFCLNIILLADVQSEKMV